MLDGTGRVSEQDGSSSGQVQGADPAGLCGVPWGPRGFEAEKDLILNARILALGRTACVGPGVALSGQEGTWLRRATPQAG